MGGKKTGPNPTDRGKSGAKRSVLTDGHGVPVGVAIDGANRPDFTIAEKSAQRNGPEVFLDEARVVAGLVKQV